MAGTVEEIMTRDPRTIEIGRPPRRRREMRDGDIGNVIVTDGRRVAGIVTDRDVVASDADIEGKQSRGIT